ITLTTALTDEDGNALRNKVIRWSATEGSPSALEEVDLLWASVLAAMCLFLLVWGLKLKRK
ncbi:MAG: hypothetical protein J7J17_02215, partial [Hadesarchaea archaeon]|nr:hypothetical protein [Hadesarchaea archaeon]